MLLAAGGPWWYPQQVQQAPCLQLPTDGAPDVRKIGSGVVHCTKDVQFKSWGGDHSTLRSEEHGLSVCERRQLFEL